MILPSLFVHLFAVALSLRLSSDGLHTDAAGMGDDGGGERWAALVRRRGVAISALQAH